MEELGGWVEDWGEGGTGDNGEALLAHLQLCGPVPNQYWSKALGLGTPALQDTLLSINVYC